MKYYILLFTFVTKNTKMERHVNHPYTCDMTDYEADYFICKFLGSTM